MLLNKILKVVLVLLAAAFVVLQGLAFEVEGATLSAITLVLLTILYYKWTKKKSTFFFWFLVVFTLADLIGLVSYYVPRVKLGQIDYLYYSANILYMLSYTFLIIKILKGFNFRKVFYELSIPIIVLVILDVFCVTLVTATAENEFTLYQYVLEFTYNTIIMVLLSVALINYMYRNDNKSMLFLLGSIFMSFSEIIQLAYYYVLDDTNLSLIYSFLLVAAFVFFYLQSQTQFSGPIPEYKEEELEA